MVSIKSLLNRIPTFSLGIRGQEIKVGIFIVGDIMKISLVLFAVLLIIPRLALAIPISDTGQAKCYDNTQEITCPNPGEPFYGQDAQDGPNLQSFTKLDESGNDLPEEATEWVMVRDNITGLIWEVKTDDDSIHDKDNTYNWYDAQDVFITKLNSQNFGKYADWRLPTVKELIFIFDGDAFDPAINTFYFPNTMSSYYWSATDHTYLSNAWFVYVTSGYVYYTAKSYPDHYVLAAKCHNIGYPSLRVKSVTTLFKQDFGRSSLQNPCPMCVSGGAWCSY